MSTLMTIKPFMQAVRKLDPVDQNVIMLVMCRIHPLVMVTDEFGEWCREMGELPNFGTDATKQAAFLLDGPATATH